MNDNWVLKSNWTSATYKWFLYGSWQNWNLEIALSVTPEVTLWKFLWNSLVFCFFLYESFKWFQNEIINNKMLKIYIHKLLMRVWIWVNHWMNHRTWELERLLMLINSTHSFWTWEAWIIPKVTCPVSILHWESLPT